MRLRITMFWNDIVPSGASETDSGEGINLSSPHPASRTGTTESEWTMKGRQRACRYEVGDEEVKETIDVPPVSILNAVDFDSVDAEISMVDHEFRLMRFVRRILLASTMTYKYNCTLTTTHSFSLTTTDVGGRACIE